MIKRIDPKVIERMRELKQSGLTFREVAEKLGEEGHKNASGKKIRSSWVQNVYYLKFSNAKSPMPADAAPAPRGPYRKRKKTEMIEIPTSVAPDGASHVGGKVLALYGSVVDVIEITKGWMSSGH